jgi:hypothetical protein
MIPPYGADARLSGGYSGEARAVGAGLDEHEHASAREAARPRRPPRTLTPSQEPRTSRTTGERQDDCAPIYRRKLLVEESDRKRRNGIGRWIEAKYRFLS